MTRITEYHWRDWWGNHRDWPITVKVAFLVRGFRVGYRCSGSLREAVKMAPVLGFISTRPLTARDVEWAESVFAAREGR